MKAVWVARLCGVLWAATGLRAAWAAVDGAVEPAGRMGFWVSGAVVLLLALLLLGWLKRSRGGVGGVSNSASNAQPPKDAPAVAPRGYSEKNVGNDASARPFERHGPKLDAGTAAGSQGGWVIGDALVSPSEPQGFDAEEFLKASKANFLALQAAWNQSDTASLRAMMTDEMLEQIKTQLTERESVGGAGPATEVVMLEARLLGVEDLDDHHMASVEFSGVLREDPSAGPGPFRELWNITRPKSGEGGWLVAGVQALQ